ncbi:radical SAM protein [Streptomyces hydrogenans]|uniref:radical SAM protein n=1 Tax=Streptomyces hydrogenans TaxID=1873719 RepID=UPI00363C91B4
MAPVPRATVTALRRGDLESVPVATRSALETLRILVPADEDERTTVLAENEATGRDRSEVHYALLPTNYCNMGCSYCGQEHRRGRLSADHRDRVRERVLRVLRLPSTRVARIDWFGAEPMIGYPAIRDLSRDFVRIADERGLAYFSKIVTNGSLLTADRIGVLVRECRVGHFEITLDGPPDVHDAHRPLKKGGGSFRTIVRVLREVVADPAYASVRFQLRTNIDVHNRDRVAEYLDLMAGLGFARDNVVFSLKPVHSWGNDVTDVELGRQEYARRETEWLRLMEERGLRHALLPGARIRSLCPAVHAGSEIISGTGKIFSCSEHPLVPAAEQSLSLGDVTRDELPLFRPEGLFDGWNAAIPDAESWCKDCPFLPVCGGSCPKAWAEGNPPCPSFKLNMQERLDLAARRFGWSVVDSGGTVEEAGEAIEEGGLVPGRQ